MSIDKRKLVAAIIGCVLCLSLIGCIAIGFFIGKRVYDTPISNEIKRDTVTLYDTIPDINPAPKDSARIKYITRWLPAKHDTINHFANASNMIHDTVAVEVPITSKHYKSEQYDAYISGFEPNLDSIFVYQKTEYITETIERTIKPKRKPWGIGFHAGYGYDFKSKTAAPFIGVGISYDIISF